MGRLIDSHIHFWDPGARHHAWLEEVPALARAMTPADVRYGGRTPDGLVFVEADRRSDEALDEVAWVSSLAQAGAPIVGTVAHVPLEQGSATEPLLEILGAEPLVVGVRRLLQDEPESLIGDPRLIEATSMLSPFGLSSDLCIRWQQLPAVTELVAACPDTTFVLDHLAKPAVADGELDPWRDDLRRLARLPNVACKLSGLATEAGPGWRPTDVLPFLRHAIDVFGPQRCMFGSDWPVLLLNGTYEEWLECVLAAIDDCSEGERDAVLGENAIRLYGLKNPQSRSADAGS
jgi:L-fuconolactonase